MDGAGSGVEYTIDLVNIILSPSEVDWADVSKGWMKPTGPASQFPSLL